MKVYVYKQYNDDYAYGEEVIEVYANKTDAEKALRKDVEDYYEVSWDEVPNAALVNDDDTFKTDYVSIYDGDKCLFWIIEEKEVL